MRNHKVATNNLYMLKYIWNFAPQKLIMSFSLSIIKGIMTIFGEVWILYYIIDCIERQSQLKYIEKILVAYFVVFSIYIICDTLYHNYYEPILDIKVKNKFVQLLINKSQELNVQDYESSKHYDEFQIARKCALESSFEVFSNFNTLIQSISMLISAIVTIIHINPGLLVFSLVSILSLFISKKYGILKAQKQNDIIHTERIKNNLFNSLVSKKYAANIRTSNANFLLEQCYSENINERKKYISKYFKKSLFLRFAQWFSMVDLVTILVYSYAIIDISLLGNISIASFSIIITSVMSVISRISKLLNCHTKAIENSVYIEQFKIFMRKKIRSVFGVRKLEKFENLEFKNVSFSYDKRNILSGINFFIKKGEKIAIVGENGAGKSTLVKLILKFYIPNSGGIYINGHNVLQFDKESYKNIFGTLFQDFCFFNIPIKENIVMAQYNDENYREMISAFQKAQAKELIDIVDKDFGRNFDANGFVASGGQYQKLALTRLFFMNRDVIIMDEPTSALDPLSENQIINNILEISKEKTVICISHRLSAVKRMDRVFFLSNGQISEMGTHDELMRKKGQYAEMFIQQSKIYNEERYDQENDV